MKILTVDLASKFTAAMLRSDDGEVHRQFDSRGKSSFQLAREVESLADEADLILIEDVPYGISSQAMTKPVLRLQGVLIRELEKQLHKVYFLNPSTWQKAYPGVATAPKGLTKTAKDAYRIEAARAHAERLGYTAPDLVAEYIASVPEGTKILKKHTNPLEKVMTDYVDAFLMNDWAHGIGNLSAFSNLAGVQPPNI